MPDWSYSTTGLSQTAVQSAATGGQLRAYANWPLFGARFIDRSAPGGYTPGKPCPDRQSWADDAFFFNPLPRLAFCDRDGAFVANVRTT